MVTRRNPARFTARMIQGWPLLAALGYLPTVAGKRAFQIPKYNIAFLKFATNRRSNQFRFARIVTARRGRRKEKISHSGESHQRRHSCIGTHGSSADIRASQSCLTDINSLEYYIVQLATNKAKGNS